MRNFNYKDIYDKITDSEILSMITQIYEFKGKYNDTKTIKPEILRSLVDVAKVQSTVSSNGIEGIITTSIRVKELMERKSEPRNRDEEEITGYRDVLDTVHENYNYININSNYILQLHRDLYKYSPKFFGGKYKNVQNYIQEEDSEENKFIKFTPPAPYDTAPLMDKLCEEFNIVQSKDLVDNLLLMPMFILDFLSVHPFNDGNGRMSRLLTLLILYKMDFNIGKYISLEMLIEKTKNKYYSALDKSSQNWHNGKNDYKPFIKYSLSIILAAYREFEERALIIEDNKLTKAEQVRKIFDNSLNSTSKSEIKEKLPHISVTTIEKVLSELLKQKYIIKIGKNKGTKYIKNNKKDK